MILPPVPGMEYRAMTMGRLVPLLAQRFGRRLEASAAVAGIPVFVRIRPGEDPDAILNGLATVTLGSWRTGADGVARLVSDPVARNRALVEERRIVREGWKNALDGYRLAERRIKSPDWVALGWEMTRFLGKYDVKGHLGMNYVRWRNLADRGPEGRFVPRLLGALSAEMLATTGPLGDVYSDRPTAAQRRLPAAALAAVRKWQAERIAFTDATEKLGLLDLARRKQAVMATELLARADAPATLGPILVRIAPSDFSEEARDVTVRLHTADGQRTHEVRESVLAVDYAPREDEPDIWDPKQMEREMKREDAKRATTPLFRYSEDALCWDAMYGHGPGRPMSAETRALVGDPLRFDPLAGAMSELAAGWAQWKDRSLVLRLPDTTTSIGKNVEFRAYDGRPDHLPDDAPPRGPVVIGVYRPIQEEARTADRAELSRLLRRVVSGDPLTLETRAAMLYGAVERPARSLFRTLTETVMERESPGEIDLTIIPSPWLAVYGGLLDVPDAYRPAGIPLTELPARLRRLLWKGVYLGRLEGWSDEEGRWRDEPTVRWPGGPPAGRLFASVTSEDLLMTATARGIGPFGEEMLHRGSATPEEVGEKLRAVAEGKVDEPGDESYDWTRLRTGTRRTIELRLTLGGMDAANGTLQTASVGEEAVPLEKLPKSIRERIEKARRGG